MNGHLWRVITLAVAIVSVSIPTHATGQPPTESGAATPSATPPATAGKESPLSKDLAAWIPAAAIVAGALIAVWQLGAQRAAARHGAQLARLNKQLSDLYGPLYAMYEAGERNWLQFLCEYSADKRPLNARKFLPGPGDGFAPPGAEALAEYRKRMKRLFMPTNHALEKAISEHADLVVGSMLPEELSSFLSHVAAATLVMRRWSALDQTKLEDIEEHRVRYPHPYGLKNYVRAAYKVLKEWQQAMLVNPKLVLDESRIAGEISSRTLQEAEAWRTQGPSYASVLGEPGA